MSEQTPRSASAPLSLPDAPNLDWLRKQAKRRLAELRKSNPSAKLADAQFDLARQYGFPSWRALKARVDALGIDGRVVDAVRRGDLAALDELLRQHPGKLELRIPPYEHTLLHAAAQEGRLEVVGYLLNRGLDPNTREKGDNTYPMHWGAAAGSLDVVRRLADAGGDVVGAGDDHALEVIGWASCWDGTEDDAHRAVVDFLLSRGARHHIFSAIAMNLADEVRRIAADDPTQLERRMSHNENFQRPLQFAARMNRPAMVRLLLELGADPLGRDGSGYPAAVYAMSTDVDPSIAEMLARASGSDLLTALVLHDWTTAERLVREVAGDREALTKTGVLHLLAKRGDASAVRWLLERGADPSGRWTHWDDDVTPLHLAALGGSAETAKTLLAAGADPTIRDPMHDSDALGWAEFFGRVEIVRMLRGG